MKTDLKYLFTAFYLDGTSFRQPDDDRSKADPSKSAFFDVDKSRLTSFQLIGHGRLVEVNLVSGQIWSDDRMVSPPLVGASGFELVYFRRHTVNLVVGGGKPAEEQSHAIEYHVGWSHPALGSQTVVLT